MPIGNWEHFFKPAVRSSGLTLVKQGKLSLTQPSDTEVIVSIRVSPPLKVAIKSPSMASPTVIAACPCPAGKKGLFCKHIWASLLLVEQKSPDFFDSKTNLETRSNETQASEKAKPLAATIAREAARAAFKEKQSLYRKIQYQKQKLRQKEYKLKKNQAPEIQYPQIVESALIFFSNNGIDLRSSMTEATLSSAKKTLSRVFHPDLGGSHEEILELNGHADNLEQFLRNMKK